MISREEAYKKFLEAYDPEFQSPEAVARFFSFLVTEHQFIALKPWHTGPDLTFDYVKNDFIIRIYYFGNYETYFIKPGNDKLDPNAGIEYFRSLNFENCKVYCSLKILDKKSEFFNSLTFQNKVEKSLNYYSGLLRRNPDVLEGNYKRFSAFNRLIHWISSW